MGLILTINPTPNTIVTLIIMPTMRPTFVLTPSKNTTTGPTLIPIPVMNIKPIQGVNMRPTPQSMPHQNNNTIYGLNYDNEYESN